ncbi:MAG: non-ribosomal peptide synthetase, partial [Lautropia mirabilis]|nr:non-ribosomal peptide synthetase [Lautropia mirabilis]
MTPALNDDTPPMDSPAGAVPLTEAQEGLWYAQQLDPRNPIFNTGHCTSIRGEVDVERLASAIERTLAEADALSLAFIDTEEGPRQYFDVARRPVLERLTLPGDAAGRAEAERLMQADLRTPIDPRTTALARHLLIRFTPATDADSADSALPTVLWFQRVHHLAADGYGMALIEQRAMQHYRAQAGTPLTSFAAVVADDAHYRDSAQRASDAAYWRALLAPLDTVGSLSERSAATGDHALHAEIDVPEDVLQALRRKEQQTLVSWPDVLTTLLAAYVQRHIGQQPVVPGVPWMGRLGNASARSVATVMNIVPLVLDMDQDRPLDELIVQTARQLKQARRHGRYRSEQMRRDQA